MFGIITKLPNFLLFIFLFITTFLLSFLLLSCYSEAEAYSSVFLTKYGFNEQDFVTVTMDNSTEAPGNYTDFSIKIGYLSFCVDYEDKLTCTTFDGIDKLNTYPIISIETENGSSSIDLIKLAAKFNDICYVYVLMVVLIITLLCLGIIFWNMIPLLPGKVLARKIVCGLSAINVLLWGIGSMLQHEATKANASLVPLSSMDLVHVASGNRAEAITWTAFSFLCVFCIGNIFLLFRGSNSTPVIPPPYK